jgi:hypothetical protein
MACPPQQRGIGAWALCGAEFDEFGLGVFPPDHYTAPVFLPSFRGILCVIAFALDLPPACRWVRWIWAGAMVVLCVCPTGCVRRRMTIRSNPPGAMVYVDDYPDPIGTTPVSHNFTYYGMRKIRLVKDGYETLTVLQPIPQPWYQVPPLDFVTENLVPGELRDRRTLSYQLAPQAVVPMDQLLDRAEELRARAQSSGIVRWSTAAPGPYASPSAGGPPPSTAGTLPSGGMPVPPIPNGGMPVRRLPSGGPPAPAGP